MKVAFITRHYELAMLATDVPVVWAGASSVVCGV